MQNYKQKILIPVPENLFLRGGTKWDFARSSLVSSVKMFYCDGLGQIFAKHFPNHKPSPSKSKSKHLTQNVPAGFKTDTISQFRTQLTIT